VQRLQDLSIHESGHYFFSMAATAAAAQLYCRQDNNLFSLPWHPTTTTAAAFTATRNVPMAAKAVSIVLVTAVTSFADC
jgi:hypothetical protein